MTMSHKQTGWTVHAGEIWIRGTTVQSPPLLSTGYKYKQPCVVNLIILCRNSWNIAEPEILLSGINLSYGYVIKYFSNTHSDPA
jgi:hypothetical protein